jgi:hypothetical protein
VPGAGSATEAAIKALPTLPAPVETPDIPEVPVPAPLPSTPKPPPPASTPSAPPAAENAVDGVSGEAGEGIARVAPEAEEPSASPGTGNETEAGAVAQRPDRHSIGPAEAAPLRRWRAYIWPAIALRVRVALAPLLTPLDDFVDDVSAPDILGLFSPPAVSDSVGIDLRSGAPAQPSQDPRSSSAIHLPEEELGFLATLLIVLLGAVGLLALARLVVGEELFETQHWRGHRG